MKHTQALTFRNRLLIFSVVLLTLLAMTGTALAGPWLFDPPIPGTPYHLWIPEGTEYRIDTRINDDGEVRFRVSVRYECDEGTYEAGINESATEPGDFLFYDTEECGDTITFRGRYNP